MNLYLADERGVEAEENTRVEVVVAVVVLVYFRNRNRIPDPRWEKNSVLFANFNIPKLTRTHAISYTCVVHIAMHFP